MSLFSLAGRVAASQIPPAAGGVRGTATDPPPPVANALERLVGFIPTETVVLFWLAVPGADSLTAFLAKKAGKPIPDPAITTDIDCWVFWILVALTPILLLLAYLSRLRSARQPWPLAKSWPWWKAAAATIAFPVWAMAVPGNPFVTDPGLLMAVWVVAALVSMVLGLLDPIIAPPT